MPGFIKRVSDVTEMSFPGLRGWRTLVLVMLFLLMGQAVAYAEADPTVMDLIVLGVNRVEPAAVINVVKTKKGDPANSERIDADVRAIYRLGLFLDVNAATESAPGGVNLVFNVVEKPFVRDIDLKGNKEISTDKIKEALAVKTGTVYTPRDVGLSVKKIKKLYADEGYYLAEVTTVVDNKSPTEVKVLFTIKEGDKIYIKDIMFSGNRNYTAKQIKKVMETKEKWFLSWITGAGTYKEEVLKNDVNLISDLYLNNGYANVKVGEPKIRLLDDKSGLVVTIGITEGDQFRTGVLDFKGDIPEDLPATKSKLQLMTGDIFNRSKLRTDVFTITDSFGDKGYAFANITPLTKMNAEAKIIDITFDMEKGEKIYIDRISVSGNSKTRDKVVRREMRLNEGQLYSGTGLKRSKQNLMNLGFFEEANLATAAGTDDKKMNINVEVKEKPTGTFSFGAGYSSVDGVVGQGSVSQSNFLGLGLKGNLAASLGGKSQTYNIGITDPYFLDTRWTLGSDIYRTQRDYNNYTQLVTGADIKSGYALTDDLSTFWLYKFEQQQLSNYQSIALADVTRLVPNSTISSLMGSISLNTTDYRPDPTKGYTTSLSIELAGIGGSTRFIRYIGEAKYYQPLFWSLVGSARGMLGYMQTIGKDIAQNDLLYAGGINTVRGYQSRTICPTAPLSIYSAGNPILGTAGYYTYTGGTDYLGGSKEGIFNLEVTFPILKEAGLKGVVFTDAGYAWGRDKYGYEQKFFSRFQTSYGAGVRWNSPMGPLRLEYGIPINPRYGIDNATGKLEFSMGSFF